MATEIKKLICIRCPQGCEITTTLDGGEIKEVKGNICRLGAEYAQDEIKAPKRVVTSTVKVKGGARPLVSVWTVNAIPKGRIFDLMKAIRQVELTAPVQIGDVVLKNALGLGVDVVSSGIIRKL